VFQSATHRPGGFLQVDASLTRQRIGSENSVSRNEEKLNRRLSAYYQLPTNLELLVSIGMLLDIIVLGDDSIGIENPLALG
jgi:hypothetical protein